MMIPKFLELSIANSCCADLIAFATVDHNPYKETYEDLPLKETVELPPKYHVPKEYYPRAKEEYGDLDF